MQREQTLSLFWTERGQDLEGGWSGCVRTANRDELHSPRTVASGVNPSCLAVDSIRGSVYWSDPSKGAITRSSLTGGEKEYIAEGSFGHRVRDGPWGLAVDPTTSTLMWSAAGHGKIRRSDLEGQNVQTISDGDSNAWSAAGPWGLAPHLRPGCVAAKVPKGYSGANSLIYPDKGLGRVFWSSWGRVSCCELADGSVRDVVSGLVDPIGLALDARNKRIFWSDAKVPARARLSRCSRRSHPATVRLGLVRPRSPRVRPSHACLSIPFVARRARCSAPTWTGRACATWPRG